MKAYVPESTHFTHSFIHRNFQKKPFYRNHYALSVMVTRNHQNDDEYHRCWFASDVAFKRKGISPSRLILEIGP